MQQFGLFLLQGGIWAELLKFYGVVNGFLEDIRCCEELHGKSRGPVWVRVWIIIIVEVITWEIGVVAFIFSILLLEVFLLGVLNDTLRPIFGNSIEYGWLQGPLLLERKSLVPLMSYSIWFSPIFVFFYNHFGVHLVHWNTFIWPIFLQISQLPFFCVWIIVLYFSLHLIQYFQEFTLSFLVDFVERDDMIYGTSEFEKRWWLISAEFDEIANWDAKVLNSLFSLYDCIFEANNRVLVHEEEFLRQGQYSNVFGCYSGK